MIVASVVNKKVRWVIWFNIMIRLITVKLNNLDGIRDLVAATFAPWKINATIDANIDTLSELTFRMKKNIV